MPEDLFTEMEGERNYWQQEAEKLSVELEEKNHRILVLTHDCQKFEDDSHGLKARIAALEMELAKYRP